MVRLAAAVAALALVLTGCNNSSTAAGPVGDLTVAVSSDGSDFQEFTLTCDPTGGSHPTSDAACVAIARAGAEVFEPVPSDVACTQIFGGPQRATVTGTYDGQQVDAEFARSDGCQIARWDALGADFFTIDASLNG